MDLLVHSGVAIQRQCTQGANQSRAGARKRGNIDPAIRAPASSRGFPVRARRPVRNLLVIGEFRNGGLVHARHQRRNSTLSFSSTPSGTPGSGTLGSSGVRHATWSPPAPSPRSRHAHFRPAPGSSRSTWRRLRCPFAISLSDQSERISLPHGAARLLQQSRARRRGDNFIHRRWRHAATASALHEVGFPT